VQPSARWVLFSCIHLRLFRIADRSHFACRQIPICFLLCEKGLGGCGRGGAGRPCPSVGPWAMGGGGIRDVPIGRV
jgi:hypothetical protein